MKLDLSKESEKRKIQMLAGKKNASMRMRLGNSGYWGSFIGGRRIVFAWVAVVGTVAVRAAVGMAAMVLFVTAVRLTETVLIAATVMSAMVMSAMVVVTRALGMIT
jgi:hypothetical protein